MRLSLRVLYTVIVVGLLMLILAWVNNPFANEEGTLTLIVYDTHEDPVIEETYPFYEEDTLFEVIDRHHETLCADRRYKPDSKCDVTFGSYGRVLLGIDALHTDWDNTFIYIEKDGTMANRGVDQIELHDGSLYAFYIKNAD